jgi:non-heme chloroperoxidase
MIWPRWSKRLNCETPFTLVTSPAAAKWLRTSEGQGTQRVAQAVLISAVPPLMPKTAANAGGTPIEEFDKLRSAGQADRSQFWKDLSMPFYGYNRPGAKISEGVRESFWLRGMMAGFSALYFCIKAFSETDQTDDDQIVPIGASAMLSLKLIEDAALKTYKGAPRFGSSRLGSRQDSPKR